MADVGDLSEDQQEVIVYSLVYLAVSGISILGIVCLSWLLGIVEAGALCAAVAASLRLMSGGAHYGSPGICAFMSVVTFPLLALGAVQLPSSFAGPLAAFAVAAAILAILRYAPVDNEAKPIPAHRRPTFRRLALALAVLWGIVFFLLSSNPPLVLAMSAGMLWQSLSLTPAGSRWYRAVDGFFSDRIKEG